MKKLILGLGSAAAAVAPVAAVVSCSFESDSAEKVDLTTAAHDKVQYWMTNGIYEDSQQVPITSSNMSIRNAYKFVGGSDYQTAYQVEVHFTTAVFKRGSSGLNVNTTPIFAANSTWYFLVYKQNRTYTLKLAKTSSLDTSIGLLGIVKDFSLNNAADVPIKAKEVFDALGGE